MGFYSGRTVLVTGHTGFKGTWLVKMLLSLGANVVGYALDPKESEPLFVLSEIESQITSIIGDIRDIKSLEAVFSKYKPSVVFHLAAQPLVGVSYDDPLFTLETNILGTINVLECSRKCESVKSIINVTTDKVYEESGCTSGYKESDKIGGYDPYSGSKACSEIITMSYRRSFLQENNVSISTIRAGNVIGGGDYSANRIMSDCVKKASLLNPIEIRNPKSIRPYQFVVEPLHAYLLIAELQYNDITYSDSYNVGPKIENCITTEELVQIFVDKWGEDIEINCSVKKPIFHESKYLMLDCSKIENKVGWKSILSIEQSVEYSVEIYKKIGLKEKITDIMDRQINDYLSKQIPINQ